jgi:hypothetical protein
MDDLLSRVEQAAELHRAGVLSDEEFATKKAQLREEFLKIPVSPSRLTDPEHLWSDHPTHVVWDHYSREHLGLPLYLAISAVAIAVFFGLYWFFMG